MDQTASKVKIANKGLFKIKGNRISSFNEGSDEANAVNEIYPDCLTECLEYFGWSFATKDATLATLSVTPLNFNDGVNIVYGYPDDYVSPITFSACGPGIVNRLQSDGIYSNYPGLLLKYVYLNDDPTTYTSKFINALACKIAHELCFKLTTAKDYAVKMSADFDKAINRAMSGDSRGGTPIGPVMNQWENARFAGSGGVVANPDGNVGFYLPGVDF